MTVRKTWLNNCGDIFSPSPSLVRFFLLMLHTFPVDLYSHLCWGRNTNLNKWPSFFLFVPFFHRSNCAFRVNVWGREKNKKNKIEWGPSSFHPLNFFSWLLFRSEFDRLMLCWWRQWHAPVPFIFRHHLWLPEKSWQSKVKHAKFNSHKKRAAAWERES